MVVTTPVINKTLGRWKQMLWGFSKSLVEHNQSETLYQEATEATSVIQ